MNTPRTEKRPLSGSSTPDDEELKKSRTVSPESDKSSKMATKNTESDIYIEGAPDWYNQGNAKISKQIKDLDTKYEDTIKKAMDSAEQAVSTVNLLEQRVKDLEGENQKMRLQMGVLEDRYEIVIEKLSKLETHSRQDNLLFEGVPESKDEKSDVPEGLIKDIVKNTLKVEKEIEFASVHRVGPIPKIANAKPRPIIVRFNNPKDKQTVWKKKVNFKDTDYVLQQNFSKRVEETRKYYYPIIRKANSMNEYKHQLYIKVDKLVYNRKEYTPDELDELPEPLRPNNVFTKTENGVYAFYGKGADLSNFRKCSFQDQGITFSCVEQHYCYNKAIYAKNYRIARKVLACEHPSEMKRLTNHLEGLEDWNEHSVVYMERALRLKFLSSQKLHKTLMSTGDRYLVEANPHDVFYGAGRGMSEEELYLHPESKGQNRLGKLLMQLRSELRTHEPQRSEVED